MMHPEDWETVRDYLNSGLRHLPLNSILLYNYAVANEKLKKYQTALTFFRIAQELKPRWADALFGEAVTLFKLGRYKESK